MRKDYVGMCKYLAQIKYARESDREETEEFLRILGITDEEMKEMNLFDEER